MLRLAADENFSGDILRGLLGAIPWSISFGFKTSDCLAPTIQQFSNGPPPRIPWSVTHDVSTLAGHAFARVTAGQPIPGVFAVPSLMAVGRAIDDLLLLTEYRHSGEWNGRVQFLPL